jgi:two-component system LytT family response regulator
LVADDEQPARKRLAELLRKEPSVGEILEAANGAAAVSLIEQERPDVVFLDVQMPGVDGFGVIEAVGARRMPLTVFVTGYDRFALKAFEAEAIDYLLKPYTDERFECTMERVKTRLKEARNSRSADPNAFGPELLQLAARRFKPGEIWHWITIKNRDGTRLLMTQDIDWIGAAGVYVTLHVGPDEYLYRAGLAAVAKHLDPFQFVRIHRSSLVNLNSVVVLERRSHGEFDVVLKSGERLLLSRSYRSEVESMLGQPL